MEIKKYIEENQQILYKIILNSKKRGFFPQAILLNAELEMPALETAKFVAKTLFCKNSKTACLECDTCRKIEEDNFLNLIVIDGDSKNISKEDIQNLIDRFSIDTSDNNSTYVYIINLIERTSKEAINAILKFLEEPLLNVHAIITTKNISAVLPTIISRCEVINMTPINKHFIIDNALKIGVNQEDAEILSYFYVNEDALKEFSESKEYLAIKEATFKYLNTLIEDSSKARFILETEVLDSLKNDNLARFFFDFVTIVLKESINCNFNIPVVLKSNEKLLINLYNRLGNVDNSIFTISELKNNLDLNINKTLLIEQLHNVLKR